MKKQLIRNDHTEKFGDKLPFAIATCLLVFTISATCNGAQENSDPSRVSLLLFPETKSWTSIKQFTVPSIKYLRDNQTLLTNSYQNANLYREMESKDCSFIERIFSTKWDFPKHFYTFDVDGDGNLDVIYSGSSQCAEGDSTLIWFGNKLGFTIKQETLWKVLTLRIKQGIPVRLSSVDLPCCGGTIETYHKGQLVNPAMEGTRNLINYTALPKKDEIPTPFTAPNTDLILRSSPVIDDTFDESSSHMEERAVLGNILSKYLPGSSGNIFGREYDAKSKLWLFVVISDESKYLRTYIPYDVDAGWIEATTISDKH